MLIVPTRFMEDDHIPLPWVVCYHFLGFLIFEDQQVNLHLEASSYMNWSVAPSWMLLHCWVQRTSITFAIRTSTPEEGEPPKKYLGTPGMSLLSMLSATSNALIMSMTSFIVVSVNVIMFCPPPYQILSHLGLAFNHQCYRWQLRIMWLPMTLGAPRPSGLHFLVHDSIHNSLVTFLHSCYSCFYLCSSPDPTNWAPQAELNVMCIAIEEPLPEQGPSKE